MEAAVRKPPEKMRARIAGSFPGSETLRLSLLLPFTTLLSTSISSAAAAALTGGGDHRVHGPFGKDGAGNGHDPLRPAARPPMIMARAGSEVTPQAKEMGASAGGF